MDIAATMPPPHAAPRHRKPPKRPSPHTGRVIYMDNNGTTKIAPAAKAAMIEWISSRANPSTDSILATRSRALIDQARRQIAAHCGAAATKYEIIFTSGASESNCLILRSAAEAYRRHRGVVPHIITSAIEHKSIIKCATDMAAAPGPAAAYVTFVAPNALGQINPADVKKAIRPETALISIMAANNEIGAINNLRAIGEIAHERNIPFHTDAVQLFGKYKINMAANRIDALSMSFHKIRGPMGLGLLIVSRDFITGYGLHAQIAGAQQGGLRGGTENVPAIAAAAAALADTFAGRRAKNDHMFRMKKIIVAALEAAMPRGEYKNYFERAKPSRDEFVILGPPMEHTYDTRERAFPAVLPNTLLVAFAKNSAAAAAAPPFCNVQLKKYLDKRDMIVSIGSACATADAKASHVLYAIRAPEVIRRGVIRISLGDDNTEAEARRFAAALIAGVKEQMPGDEAKKE